MYIRVCYTDARHIHIHIHVHVDIHIHLQSTYIHTYIHTYMHEYRYLVVYINLYTLVIWLLGRDRLCVALLVIRFPEVLQVLEMLRPFLHKH